MKELIKEEACMLTYTDTPHLLKSDDLLIFNFFSQSL